MKKRIITITSIILFFMVLYVYFYFNPVFIGKQKEIMDNCHCSNNICNPIDSLDFSKGNNNVFIYIDKADIQFLPIGIKKRTMFSCRDNAIIQKIKENFHFEKESEAFYETTAANSMIFFFKDKKMVFRCPFIFDENIALHFEKTGWVFSINYPALKELFGKFKPVYFPILIF